jgi:hypothetical protein
MAAVPRPSSRLHGLVAALFLATAFPLPAWAQVGVIVEGRIYDADSGIGIQNATVELGGHGSTLTSLAGTFRFERVALRAYILRVEAFGYAAASRFLSVAADITVSIPVVIAPFALDSVLVESRLIDLEGRVRDPTRDLDVVDAEILTDQVETTWTRARGQFDLEDVVADIPLRIVVLAFGYFAVDTILLPDEDEDYLFEVEPDPMVERMIEVQVHRLEDRASPRRSVLMRPMNRDRVLTHAGRRTVAGMLEWEYGSRLRGVRCVLVNEEQLLGAWEPSSLFHILPEGVERVEVLFGGAMVRIYTREFMREMVGREVELRAPIYFHPFPERGVDPLCR